MQRLFSTTPRLAVLIVAFLGALGGGSLGAKTQVDVELGWSGKLRPCRWTPVWVTLSDPVRRGAVLELYAPNNDRMALRITQRVPMGATPLTFPLYAPLIGQLDDCVLKVRELQDDG